MVEQGKDNQGQPRQNNIDQYIPPYAVLHSHSPLCLGSAGFLSGMIMLSHLREKQSMGF